MDKKNLMPQVAQPVNRTTAGQMPPELAELSEEALQQHGEGTAYSTSLLASLYARRQGCSYDGDDAE